MKRAPHFYPRVFDNADEARGYADSARSRARQVGETVADGLIEAGFTKGRILEVGCGAGDLSLALAQNYLRGKW